jgi:hypothetical protein
MQTRADIRMTSGRKGRPDGNFHPKTSVMTTLASWVFYLLVLILQ